jgi:ribose transport system permease protein
VAGFRELFGDRAADSAGGTGDQGISFDERHGGIPSSGLVFQPLGIQLRDRAREPDAAPIITDIQSQRLCRHREIDDCGRESADGRKRRRCSAQRKTFPIATKGSAVRVLGGRVRKIRLTQEGVVLALAVAMCVVFAVALPNFLTTGNLIALVRSVSILGILGLGMGLVVIARGIDLALIATMVVSVSWVLSLTTNSGWNLGSALLLGAGFVILIGLINGLLIAYATIPAIFTTLAMGLVVYGVGRGWLFQVDVQNTPDNSAFFNFLGRTTILGIPMLIVAFLVLAFVIWLALRWTRFGRFVYAMGDNPAAARIVGLPVRPMIVAEHIIVALIAYAAGLVMAAASSGMSTRVYNSTMIYDVLLVVVLGGIGLSGGRGGVRNILVGTLLVGVLLDGMTIMDVPYIEQNLIKSIILLCAIVVDSIINPRDEQTAQQEQGDI